ncbi:MAG: glucose/mannose-6-phosphate isomerase [Parcubacteria group bacterium Gr01-1014_44]|nr:MAG: glucose/mannose-6-phosphate isomerase [Parcubacteria group bacterium Gr01-1014_44]
MIEENIKNFNKQFSYEPVLENAGSLEKKPKTILLGMGGSHLAADLLNAYDPGLGLVVHSNYGLPSPAGGWPKDSLRDYFVIASSHSGNTEEVLDGLQEALERGLPVAVISTGGRLLEIAKEKNLPFIQLPAAGLVPRMSTGFHLRALAKLLGHQTAFDESGRLASQLNPAEFEKSGRELAEKIKDRIPLIYASQANYALAFNWKTVFNETGKVPAFYNLFPELNHHEINSFDSNDSIRHLSEKFTFLILADSQDHPRIQKRMEVLVKLYRERNFPVEIIQLSGEGRFYRIFSCLMLADWTGYYTARQYGLDPEAIPLVEKFKKLMS